MFPWGGGGGGVYIRNIQGLGLLVSLKKIFKSVAYTGLCKTSDPWRKHFQSRGCNLNDLGRGLLDKVKYQTANPWTRKFIKSV